MIIKLLVLLLTTFWALSGTLALAARDMTSTDIMGLRVGMTKDEAKKIIDGMAGKTDVAEMASNAKLNGKTGSVCHINFKDDKFLSITFLDTAKGSLTTRIALVYQGESYSEVLLKQLLAQFGKPDHRVKQGIVVKAAWGGKADDGGGITPLRKIKTTLRLEEIRGQHITVSLDSHGQ